MEVTEHTAAEHIKAAERLLRETFARRLSACYGADWESRLSNKMRDRLVAIREQEREARPHARDQANLLGYAGFDHLKSITQSHWDGCIAVLPLWPSLDYALRELDRLHAIRNPVQHGRTVFPHEYVEGEGIARRLRFEIEQWRRQEASVAGEYWLYIEEAEDSLGNRATNPKAASTVEVKGKESILVGDTVTLRVRAFDPLGRELQYRLYGTAATSEWQVSPEIEWTATTPGRSIQVFLYVCAKDEPHAYPILPYDAAAIFAYDVRLRLERSAPAHD